MQTRLWEYEGVGSDVFVKVFVKGHALIHSGEWKGHAFSRKKFLKYPDPLPPNKKHTFPNPKTFKGRSSNPNGDLLARNECSPFCSYHIFAADERR